MCKNLLSFVSLYRMGEETLRREYQRLVEGDVNMIVCFDLLVFLGLQRVREERETDARLANPVLPDDVLQGIECVKTSLFAPSTSRGITWINATWRTLSSIYETVYRVPQGMREIW